MRLSEHILRQYYGLDFRGLLERVLWEKKALISTVLDSYNRPIDTVNEYHAGAVFMKRYGYSLTIGDIGALETSFDAHANVIWKQIQDAKATGGANE